MALLDSVRQALHKRSSAAIFVNRYVKGMECIALESASSDDELDEDAILDDTSSSTEYSDEDLTRLRQSKDLKEFYESGGDETVAWVRSQLADVCSDDTDDSGVTTAEDDESDDEEDDEDNDPPSESDKMIEDIMSDIETPDLELETNDEE